VKTALITGAAKGMGRVIAQHFGRAGYALCVTDLRDMTETERMLIAEFGSERVLAITADLALPETPARIILATIQKFGRLDTIINNAADQRGTTLAETDLATFDTVYFVNVRSPFLLAKAALPHLKITRGSIINLGSLVGNQPIPERVAYSTSKAALAGLTRALATDIGREGVRVNAIAPGHIMTDGEDAWRTRFSPEEQAVFFTHYPMGRVGTPEDIASVALFLASDAASFLTGATIPVDGGMSVLCPEISAFRAAHINWPGNPGG
jgi:NAD(P)-dependent dehydrogenase (short-subunit alcohol dehydrogenase family)